MEILFAGVDIGSTTSKAVVLDEKGNIMGYGITQTAFDRNKSGQEALALCLAAARRSKEDIAYVVSTGYGRRAFGISNKVLPEIVCHAKGTVHLYPGTRTIIDIGGQDSKVIELDDEGRVTKFEMNDKCAAGTGRFFEVLTERLLGIRIDELGPLSLKSEDSCVISSVCTVFAESEIISYLSEGRSKEDIIAGMNFSVAKRVVAMARAGRILFQEPVVFTGGVARNIGMKKAFEEILEKRVITLEQPQSTAALGAAIYAKEAWESNGEGISCSSTTSSS